MAVILDPNAHLTPRQPGDQHATIGARLEVTVQGDALGRTQITLEIRRDCLFFRTAVQRAQCRRGRRDESTAAEAAVLTCAKPQI
ncbi:hypothetical protein [Nannocystis punicea]|uniref:Uncharacterized protein n=1 Tax=Nannocystis punicea TaxID=2995304 RepID=A0ABY7HC67_9BACT|nr:hypothetical protein [Nannocystis poenicansa]WAS96708.1 hypothetical protein O0S08_11205 [Nannocystis poenicansa]